MQLQTGAPLFSIITGLRRLFLELNTCRNSKNYIPVHSTRTCTWTFRNYNYAGAGIYTKFNIVLIPPVGNDTAYSYSGTDISSYLIIKPIRMFPSHQELQSSILSLLFCVATRGISTGSFASSSLTLDLYILEELSSAFLYYLFNTQTLKYTCGLTKLRKSSTSISLLLFLWHKFWKHLI